MTRKSFDLTLHMISGLDRARSVKDICDLLLNCTAKFGVTHILAGTIPTLGSPAKKQRDNILLHHWPQEWANRYFNKNYIFQDPTIKHISDVTKPFLWSELNDKQFNEPKSTLIMNEAKDFNLHEGFTVPLVTLEQEVVGFSFAGEHLDIDDSQRNTLMLLALYAIGRAIALRADVTSEVIALSPREKEALQWAAEGKTRWEIGELMCISEHGADKHLRMVREKLGTTTTSFAIAEAIRYGLIC